MARAPGGPAAQRQRAQPSINQSINKSINHPIHLQINQSTHHSSPSRGDITVHVHVAHGRHVLQEDPRPEGHELATNQSTNQSTTQSINQSTIQSTSPSLGLLSTPLGPLTAFPQPSLAAPRTTLFRPSLSPLSALPRPSLNSTAPPRD